MKTYKDTNNNLFAYELDGSQDYLISSKLIQITDEEANAIRQAVVAAQPKTFAPLNPAQVRLVLHQFGLLDTVEAAIKAGDKSLQIEWDYRTEFARDNALLLSMATTLGITDSQLDEMFEIGITL